MNLPVRGPNDLYGLHDFKIVGAEVPLADGIRRYLVLSLHVSPIADTAGTLRALPAVCLDMAKAEALHRALGRALKKSQR